MCLRYKSLETVEKGEIARNKQFLLFPQCFPQQTAFENIVKDMDKWTCNYLIE